MTIIKGLPKFIAFFVGSTVFVNLVINSLEKTHAIFTLGLGFAIVLFSWTNLIEIEEKNDNH